MKRIQLIHQESARIEHQEIVRIGSVVYPEIERLRAAYQQGYDSVYASINLSHDSVMHEQVLALVQHKKGLAIACLVVIGIGGSSLGTQAIHEAVHGKLYNEQNPEVKIYFIDTVDADTLYDVREILKTYLEAGKKILINVVTKSGLTTETIANFEVIRSLLQGYYPETYHHYVVVTTDKESLLWQMAQERRYAILEIPKKVGGRFSVLSPVGLFPCAFLGIDIKKLCDGARDGMQQFLSYDIAENSAALSAIIKYIHYRYNAINMSIMFVFSVYFEALGKWYCQLIGESIGKEYDVAGKKVHVGITPLVSVGTTDLHSVGQLYLGGPYDKFITFCSLEYYTHEVKIPSDPLCIQQEMHIEGKAVHEVMEAILEGVKRAYHKEERPFCELIIPQRNPYYIGQFLQLYMIEIMYLGYLLHINPFDQPNVELYKEETREILQNE